MVARSCAALIVAVPFMKLMHIKGLHLSQSKPELFRRLFLNMKCVQYGQAAL